MRRTLYFIGGPLDSRARAYPEGRIPPTVEAVGGVDMSERVMTRERYETYILKCGRDVKPIHIAIVKGRDLRTELERVFLERTTATD